MKKKPCKRCSKHIPVARQRALPETELCLKCSEEVGGDFVYVFSEGRLSKPGSMKINYGGITIKKYRRDIRPL